MRLYVTAQRRQGITEPAKEITLASGPYLTSNFVIPGKPQRENSKGTKDIVVAIAVPTDNKRMVRNLQQMSQASVSEALENCNLLVSGLAEVIQDYLLGRDKSELTEQAVQYVRTVEQSFTWGPGGLSGTADLVLFPTTMDVISKQAIARRSELQTDATIIRTQKDENGTPRVTKTGNKLKRVGPCYRSLIAPGMSAGSLRAWPTKVSLAMFAALSDEDTVVALEGGLVKKGWATDDGEERSNLEVQVQLLFPVGLRPDYIAESLEEKAEVAATDTTSTSNEVAAMNNDFDDDNNDIDDDY